MNTNTRRKPRTTRPRGDSETEAWEWLWRNTDYSPEELAANSMIPERNLMFRIPLLICGRVIYPDGTVNSRVLRLLRSKVVSILATGPSGKGGKEARADSDTR